MKTSLFRFALAVNLASLFFSMPLLASDVDDRIVSSAQETYVFKTYLKGDDVKVRSEDGVVTLTGSVSEEFHKNLARETIAGLPGVKNVNNHLEIKGEDTDPFSDGWLITKVKTTLFFHRNVSATKTEVLAEDGTITLRGEAASKAQKDLTTEYARDVEGVKNVKNEMTIVMKDGEKTMGERVDDVVESIDDTSITALVKVALLYHRSTSALNTTVETKDGVVTLRGNAENAAEKDLATKVVSDVHGVKDVANHMTVD